VNRYWRRGRIATMLLMTAAGIVMTGGIAWGLLHQHIEGVGGVAGAENVMLVRVPGGYAEGVVMEELDGVRTYEVKVLAVWHSEEVWGKLADEGERKEIGATDTVKISTADKELKGGRQYLVAGGGGSQRGEKPWLLFYFVMEVPGDFHWRGLEKKPVAERVRAAMEARRKDVEKQLKELEAEKTKLEGWLKEEKK
jgi:hypothetical protein